MLFPYNTHALGGFDINVDAQQDTMGGQMSQKASRFKLTSLMYIIIARPNYI